jgi:diaminopimelate epimerase
MALRFFKYEGLGNDFVIVEAVPHAPVLGTAQGVRLCDRHLGIGADGVLVVAGAETAQPMMRVINADGTHAEMCGNGIRCVALHLHHQGRGAEFDIDTDAGVHRCRVLAGGRSGMVEVSMPAPSLVPERVPVLADGPLIDAPFEAAGRTLRVTAISMGNPHLVSFDDVGDARGELGPALERHARTPHGANVGFAKLVGPAQIELVVFERGAGWTRACGTGACAAAVAAVETGRAKPGVAIEVRLPGGLLTIVVPGPGQRVAMTGPARRVFEGSVELD